MEDNIADRANASYTHTQSVHYLFKCYGGQRRLEEAQLLPGLVRRVDGPRGCPAGDYDYATNRGVFEEMFVMRCVVAVVVAARPGIDA